MMSSSVGCINKIKFDHFYKTFETWIPQKLECHFDKTLHFKGCTSTHQKKHYKVVHCVDPNTGRATCWLTLSSLQSRLSLGSRWVSRRSCLLRLFCFLSLPFSSYLPFSQVLRWMSKSIEQRELKKKMSHWKAQIDQQWPPYFFYSDQKTDTS